MSYPLSTQTWGPHKELDKKMERGIHRSHHPNEAKPLVTTLKILVFLSQTSLNFQR